jgi:hypothetical protein
MQAPTIFAGVIPLVMCCHLILNLQDGYEKPPAITSTQGTELSKFSIRVRKPPLNGELDSTGLTQFTGEQLVPCLSLAVYFSFVAITIIDSDEA